MAPVSVRPTSTTGTSGACRERAWAIWSVVVGSSIAQVVGRSLYLEVNARIQADAIQLGTLRPLDGDASRLMLRTPGDYERAWELWKRQTVAARATERKPR